MLSFTQTADHLNGIILCECLPAADDALAIDGIEFTQVCASASLVSRNQRRPAAAKWIQYNGATFRDILDGIGNHLHRFDRGMQRQFLKPAGFSAC